MMVSNFNTHREIEQELERMGTGKMSEFGQMDYLGLRFHSDCDDDFEHNRKILSHFGICDEIINSINAWKGVIAVKNQSRDRNNLNCDLGETIKEFSGETSADIIYYLSKNNTSLMLKIILEESKHKKFIYPYETYNSYNNSFLIEDNDDVARNITHDQRHKVMKRQKWRCNICNSVLKFNINSEWEGEIGHIDHIHPFSKRHTYPKGPQFINEDENLQALCPKCNLGKGKREIN